MITKEDLRDIISGSKHERSFEEECVADIVQTGTEWCNDSTCQSEGVHYHPVNEVIYETVTRTEVKYDYERLRLEIAGSTRNLEQLVVLQEVALENQGTKEFNEYKISYRDHLRNVNKKYPQLVGNLVSTVLNDAQIPIQKKQEFIVDAIGAFDFRSDKDSPFYEPPYTRDQKGHYDLEGFSPETREPLREFLKGYTPDLEFSSRSRFYQLWMSENPERISSIVAMIGSQAKQNPAMIGKLLNPENGTHCFDERDFLPGAFPYVKDAVQALTFDSAQIANSKDQYNTRLWCKLNAEKALDIVVDSLLRSCKLNNVHGLSQWEGIPEIYEPLKNGITGKKDARFANALLKNVDTHIMGAIEFAKTMPAIGISPMPEYAVPQSGYERVISCAKGLVNLLAVGGLAISSAFASKYGMYAMNPAHAQAQANESPLLYGFGGLSIMAVCAFASLPIGIGIAVYLNGRLDDLVVPETPAQKEYGEEQLKKLDAWRMNSISKIRQHYQPQVAI